VSVVISSDRLQGFALNLTGYIRNFYAMIDQWRVLPAGLPDWSSSADAEAEQLGMLWDWLQSNKRVWGGFNRRWSFHLIPTDQRKALTEDWILPIKYTLVYAKKYALPQYPQERRRINDPTDPLGRKRSIRVHFAEKSK